MPAVKMKRQKSSENRASGYEGKFENLLPMVSLIEVFKELNFPTDNNEANPYIQLCKESLGLKLIIIKKYIHTIQV